MWKILAACAVCLLLVDCSTPKPEPEPASRLILGGDEHDAAPGRRALGRAQQDKLQAAITSAGELCGAIERTYLRDVAADFEAWDVRCTESGYSVEIAMSGPARVRPCIVPSAGDAGCFHPYSAPRTGPSELNPDLGKLLAPMTAPNGKND